MIYFIEKEKVETNRQKIEQIIKTVLLYFDFN